MNLFSLIANSLKGSSSGKRVRILTTGGSGRCALPARSPRDRLRARCAAPSGIWDLAVPSLPKSSSRLGAVHLMVPKHGTVVKF